MRLPYIVGKPTGYASDTGIDVEMQPTSPLIAIAKGSIPYAEGWGKGQRTHTPWVATLEYPMDTPGAILLKLDTPLISRIGLLRYAWYCHCSSGFAVVRWGIDAPRRVSEGMMIGHSGYGRGVAHLHFGLLTDTDQAPGHFLPPFEILPLLISYGAK